MLEARQSYYVEGENGIKTLVEFGPCRCCGRLPEAGTPDDHHEVGLCYYCYLPRILSDSRSRECLACDNIIPGR